MIELKQKLKYFLEKTKQALEMLGRISNFKKDTKYVYFYLYSFATHLKAFTTPEIGDKYLALARKLSNKDELTREEFLDVISQISAMSNDIEDYLPKKERDAEKAHPFT